MNEREMKTRKKSMKGDEENVKKKAPKIDFIFQILIFCVGHFAQYLIHWSI